MVDAPLSCVDPLFEASPWRLLRHPRDASRFPGRIVVDPAPAAFRWQRSGCPGPPAVQSRHVRECGTASPQEAVVWLRSAHESGERSRSGMNRIMSRNTARSAAHLKRFYDLLSVLEHRIGGPRRLVNCSGHMDWPCRGVYFFRETGERGGVSVRLRGRGRGSRRTGPLLPVLQCRAPPSGPRAQDTRRGVCRQRLMAQGSVKPANQRGRGTLIALSNYRGPLLRAVSGAEAYSDQRIFCLSSSTATWWEGEGDVEGKTSAVTFLNLQAPGETRRLCSGSSRIVPRRFERLQAESRSRFRSLPRPGDHGTA